MRAVLALGGLSATTLLLQGCGGGDTSKPCVNTQMELVSQSFDAKSNTKIKVSGEGVPQIDKLLDMDMTQKMDVDMVNMFMSVSTDMEIPDAQNKTLKVHLDEKVILNAAKKEAVMKIAFTGTGAPPLPNNCSKINIPKMPPPSQISTMLKALVAAMSSKMKCTGNDGTYDSFVLSLTLPDPSIPVPGDAVTGTMKETIKMDKDYILHSTDVSTNLKIKMPRNSSNSTMMETEEMTMTTSNTKKGGPSDSDLDYSSWGDCKEIKPPPHTSDLLDVLAKSVSPHETVLPHVISKSLRYRLVMQAAQQAMDGATTDIVTV